MATFGLPLFALRPQSWKKHRHDGGRAASFGRYRGTDLTTPSSHVDQIVIACAAEDHGPGGPQLVVARHPDHLREPPPRSDQRISRQYVRRRRRRPSQSSRTGTAIRRRVCCRGDQRSRGSPTASARPTPCLDHSGTTYHPTRRRVGTKSSQFDQPLRRVSNPISGPKMGLCICLTATGSARVLGCRSVIRQSDCARTAAFWVSIWLSTPPLTGSTSCRPTSFALSRWHRAVQTPSLTICTACNGRGIGPLKTIAQYAAALVRRLHHRSRFGVHIRSPSGRAPGP